MEKLVLKIYKLLTDRRFRSGPLPSEDVKKLITGKISSNVSKNFPIKIFMFWGGCKNPNLAYDKAELCEESTLDNYKKLAIEIKKIYPPGIKIYISPGDYRVEKVNLIPKEKAKVYVNSLIKISKKEKYQGIFTVIPLSKLYDDHKVEFENKLKEVKKRISREIPKNKNFEKLITNAKKNIPNKNFISEKEILVRANKAAKNYIIYRVAEEESRLFNDFEDCIRAFFIKYSPFYKNYIKNVYRDTLSLDCSLVFYTGGKGNITQPWQAIGKKVDGKVIFLSQSRLKK